ncbi:hypothetical protein OC861_006655 [Tilletia horrida]|nr:hypothetical protein OC861_006655 [Tilletia horrida]
MPTTPGQEFAKKVIDKLTEGMRQAVKGQMFTADELDQYFREIRAPAAPELVRAVVCGSESVSADHQALSALIRDLYVAVLEAQAAIASAETQTLKKSKVKSTEDLKK